MKKYNPRNKFFRTPLGIAALILLLAVSVLAAVRMGSARMTNTEFFGGLLRADGYEMQARIIYLVRLPRVLGAVISGVGLSISGVLLQSVTGNELAAPNIIGVNSGAGFAVIMLLFFAPQAALLSPFAAFLGAFLTTMLIVSVASRINSTSSAVILSGIAVTAILNAGISFISLIDSDVLSAYNYFSIGGFSGVRLQSLYIPMITVFLCAVISVILSRRIDVLCLGDSTATALGVRVKLLRTVCLIIASAAASSVVSFAGLLGFVGLVVPHISRKLCGSSVRYLIPVSALCGAVLVVSADLLGRILFAPSEIPVGIIMAFIGAPFFFCLLLRRNKNDNI